MDTEPVEGFTHGGFPFAGTRLRDGKVEEVSGSISWKAMPTARESKNGESDVHAAMFIPGSRDPLPGGGGVVDSDFVERLAKDDREAQAALIGMMDWKRREGYDVHCVRMKKERHRSPTTYQRSSILE